mmetsp:Transcript_62187/g.158122  ORF Transcript_62187/g.158122 Transcript_62187/m.158122 type:complete len:173 (-) Transcript_62187:128-646(-)|eukprot:CAMPEP_0183561292 /NCGR_PEP_ID=MMETSP0371-20130417/96655_1 /TAXON_ID=268820 /ORGANISM="Peridinium aciculiferum, Strain PAER-2" /LENGTH=172 /DNA_ID=CAMNT_0025769759 /DNA_START=1 /DNA_END=519 /DNA_ORIENTATION=-
MAVTMPPQLFLGHMAGSTDRSAKSAAVGMPVGRNGNALERQGAAESLESDCSQTCEEISPSNASTFAASEDSPSEKAGRRRSSVDLESSRSRTERVAEHIVSLQEENTDLLQRLGVMEMEQRRRAEESTQLRADMGDLREEFERQAQRLRVFELQQQQEAAQANPYTYAYYA